MKEIKQQTFCHEGLTACNKVKFTAREIDIIACLISGRGAKATAALLSITEKTVETHTRNIMRKLECNSQEFIREKIEKSYKLFAFKNHYLSLLTNQLFENCLQKIKLLNDKEEFICHFIYWKEKNPLEHYISQLEMHLQYIGIKTIFRVRDAFSYEDYLSQIRESKQRQCIVYVYPTYLQEQTLTDESLINQDIAMLSQVLKEKPKSVIFILHDKNTFPNSWEENTEAISIDLSSSESYYILFFNLLKSIFTDTNLDEIRYTFLKQYENIYDNKEKNVQDKPWSSNTIKESLQSTSEYDEIYSISALTEGPKGTSQHSSFRKVLIQSLCQPKFYGGLLFIAGAFAGAKFLKIDHISKISFVNQDNIHKNYSYTYSNLLPLPEATFLHRTELLAKISNKFKKERDIQKVAIVGVGGAGKTTLARQYAFAQESSIIWQINAENCESLKYSFEALASALAQTEEDKKSLREAQDIQNSKEKEKKILQFVKKRLNHSPHWLLIYDNIENFEELHDSFPLDPHEWGSGKVIITTRNGTIENNQYLKKDDIVKIGELNTEDRFDLFTKILYSKRPSQLATSEIREIKLFLTNIPPFPLDVSTAAHYLQVTNISYEEYLQRMSKYSHTFKGVQEDILKDISDYTKTRHGIISLSIERILGENKDFKELLLLVSFLDSQDIPRKLLECYKDAVIVDSFLHHLKKHSLIMEEASAKSNSGSTFSIHRSIQAISFFYLTQIFNLKNNIQQVEIITLPLERYVADMVEKDNIAGIKLLTPHIESFIRHKEFISPLTKANLYVQLGSMYIRTHFDFLKAINLLEESVGVYKSYYTTPHPKTAWALLMLGRAYTRVGKTEREKECIEESRSVYKSLYPMEDQLEMVGVLMHLGSLYRRLCEYKKAETSLEKSYTIYKKSFGDNDIHAVWSLGNLGRFYRHIGNYKKAKALVERALTIYQTYHKEAILEITWLLVNLGIIHQNLGDYEKAKNLIENALTTYKQHYSDDDAEVAYTLIHLATVYMHLGDLLSAKKLVEKSLRDYKHHYGEDNVETAWALAHMGIIYRELKEYPKAYAFFNKSLNIYTKHYGAESVPSALILYQIGQTNFVEGNIDTAETLFNKALYILKKNNYPKVYKILESLDKLYLKKSTNSAKQQNSQQKRLDMEKVKKNLDELIKAVSIYFPKDSPYFIKINNKKHLYH